MRANHLFSLLMMLMVGCIRIPPLPSAVQNRIVPQGFEWQHKDILQVEFKETTDREFHRRHSVRELFDSVKVKLDGLDYQPKNYSGIKATLILSVPEKDLDRRIRDQSYKTAGRWGRYTKHPAFKSVLIPVEDDLNLTGVLAVRDETHPYVILLSGTFDGRDALYARDTALLCYRYGYNVLVLETRNHGQSIEYWTAIGWKEGMDVLAAAKWLKGMKEGDGAAKEQPSVAVIGFSLGAWYGIRAAYDASVTSQEHLLNGGVIAFNPPVDIKKAILDWNRDAYRGSEFTLRSQIFKQFDAYLSKRINELGKEREFKAAGETFDAYIALAASAHQLSREELYQRAVLSPEQIAEKVRVPVVVYHAEDDPVVGVKHSQDLKRAIEVNDSGYIKVLIEEKGGHIALSEVDPEFYVNVILTVLEGLKR